MSPTFKVIITVIITAAVIGGGGWYYMDRTVTKEKNDLQAQIVMLQQQIKDLSAETTTSTATTSESSTPATTDETAGWKTYTNSTYGFSFKYPATWTAADNLGQAGNWTVSKKLEIKDSTNLLDVYVNPDGFGPFFPDYEYEITASSTGLIISSKNPGTDENRLDGSTLIIGQFTYGSSSYLIHYKVSGSDSASRTTLDTLLSTFQFTK